MKRLIEKMVFFGLVIDWRLATWPTSRSSVLVKATTEGVVRLPSALGMTLASPPSMTATTLLVVPRSIPMVLLTGLLLYRMCSASARGWAHQPRDLSDPLSIRRSPDMTIIYSTLFPARQENAPKSRARPVESGSSREPEPACRRQDRRRG